MLLKRGDTWPITQLKNGAATPQLHPSVSGTSGNPIVVDAYGTGANPILQPAYDLSQQSNWTNRTDIGPHIWQSVQTFAPTGGESSFDENDVGNLIWNCSPLGGTNVPPAALNCTVGNMLQYNKTAANLANPGDWIFKTSSGTDQYTVQVYSTSNPAISFHGIVAALNKGAIDNGQSYWVFQNLTIQKGAGSAINTCGGTGMVFRDIVMQYIGGGNIGGVPGGSRYGDFVPVECGTTNVLLERAWMAQGYDGGGGNIQTGNYPQNNYTMRNSVVWNFNGNILQLNASSGGPGTVSGFYAYNNSSYGLNNSWAYTPVNQRTTTSGGNGNGGYGNFFSMASNITVDHIQAENNSFAGLVPSVYAIRTSAVTGFDLTNWTATVFDYNLYSNSDSSAPRIFSGGSAETIATWGSTSAANGAPFETHGIGTSGSVQPGYMSGAAGNLAPNCPSSALCGAGVNLCSAVPTYGSPSGVVWDFNKTPRNCSATNIGAFGP